MVLGPKDVSKVVLGILTPYTINFLKHIKDFFGVSFKIDPYKEQFIGVDDDTSDLNLGSPKFIFSCMGVGYTNISKPQLIM
ncbi:putative RNA 3'-terminal phosphate cyclase-like protein [Armadillidium nasatum]|uniref:Putative RNA 3'-terminal phosphate cyclase-like protein n=1 Tax=Armadillidium nasatum TaxID=96803 RepID=A0A5N5SQB8_9CRUS|nr:putative RNA 3'-terminal phosphate cyclase-like protein [Armadillidium nasatum]